MSLDRASGEEGEGERRKRTEKRTSFLGQPFEQTDSKTFDLRLPTCDDRRQLLVVPDERKVARL